MNLLANQPWSGSHRELLRQVAEEAFQRAEGRGVTGKDLMWQAAKEEILSDLEIFLDEDFLLRERFGTSPHQVEAGFGRGEGSWPEASLVTEDGKTLRFQGIIDRVDIDASGQNILVMDYKTGSMDPYRRLRDDLVDRGKRLQLPIYALAARAALGEQVRVQAASLLTT